MKKTIKMAMAVISIGVALIFSGCGLEDMMLQTQVETLVRQHMEQQDEILKFYDIDQCSNFIMAAEVEGVRNGSVDLGLKNKKTGAIEKLAYKFKYTSESGEIEVGVKNPMQAVKLFGISNME